MKAETFKKLSKQKKYRLIKEKGHHIASRYYQSYHIHLYKLGDVLAEVWFKLGLNQIYWIEPVGEERIELYADSVNLKSVL